MHYCRHDTILPVESHARQHESITTKSPRPCQQEHPFGRRPKQAPSSRLFCPSLPFNETILPLTQCRHCRRTGRGRPRRESQRRAARTARGPREDVARLVDDQSAAQCRAMSRLGCAAEADASPSLLALRLMRANARSLATYSREEWETIPPGRNGRPFLPGGSGTITGIPACRALFASFLLPLKAFS